MSSWSDPVKAALLSHLVRCSRRQQSQLHVSHYSPQRDASRRRGSRTVSAVIRTSAVEESDTTRFAVIATTTSRDHAENSPLRSPRAERAAAGSGRETSAPSAGRLSELPGKSIELIESTTPSPA